MCKLCAAYSQPPAGRTECIPTAGQIGSATFLNAVRGKTATREVITVQNQFTFGNSNNGITLKQTGTGNWVLKVKMDGKQIYDRAVPAGELQRTLQQVGHDYDLDRFMRQTYRQAEAQAREVTSQAARTGKPERPTQRDEDRTPSQIWASEETDNDRAMKAKGYTKSEVPGIYKGPDGGFYVLRQQPSSAPSGLFSSLMSSLDPFASMSSPLGMLLGRGSPLGLLGSLGAPQPDESREDIGDSASIAHTVVNALVAAGKKRLKSVAAEAEGAIASVVHSASTRIYETAQSAGEIIQQAAQSLDASLEALHGATRELRRATADLQREREATERATEVLDRLKRTAAGADTATGVAQPVPPADGASKTSTAAPSAS